MGRRVSGSDVDGGWIRPCLRLHLLPRHGALDAADDDLVLRAEAAADHAQVAVQRAELDRPDGDFALAVDDIDDAPRAHR